MLGTLVWPRNAWGAPRGVPLITRWLTRRAHRRLADAVASGFREGLESSQAKLARLEEL